MPTNMPVLPNIAKVLLPLLKNVRRDFQEWLIGDFSIRIFLIPK